MEQKAHTYDLEGDGPARTSGAAPSTDRHELRIRDVMTQEVVTVAADETILAAARKMSGHSVSCVVVVDGQQVRGILTEKDVLKGVAGRNGDFCRLRVAERMSSPATVISADMSIMEAGRAMDAKGIRRLPVVDNARLVGIITQTDITRGLISLSPIRYLGDIMARDVATVDAQATVDEAARTMSERNISCLIALHRGEAAGIVTEKDLLKRIVALHKDPARTRVDEIMSFPIVAVPPTYSILSASKKMDMMHLHRLVIMEGKEIRGIVTKTDLLRAIRAAFEAMESQQRALMKRLTDVVQYVTRDAGKAQEFLAAVENSVAGDNPAWNRGATHPEQVEPDPGVPCIL